MDRRRLEMTVVNTSAPPCLCKLNRERTDTRATRRSDYEWQGIAPVDPIFVRPQWRNDLLQAVEATAKGLREGWLKSTIASRFSLDRIVNAHEAVESGKTVGKVVINIH